MKTLTLCCLLLTTITPALAATGKPTTVTGRLAHGFWGFSITPQKGPRIDFPDEAPFSGQVRAICEVGDLCTLSGLVAVDRNGDHQLTDLTSVTLVKPMTLDTRSAAEKAEDQHRLIPMVCIGEVHVYDEYSGLGSVNGSSIIFPTDGKLADTLFSRCQTGEVCKVSGLGKLSGDRHDLHELTVIQAIERLSPTAIIPAQAQKTKLDNPDIELELQGQLEAKQDSEGEGFWLRGSQLAQSEYDKKLFFKLTRSAALDRATRDTLAQLAADGVAVLVKGFYKAPPDVSFEDMHKDIGIYTLGSVDITTENR